MSKDTNKRQNLNNEVVNRLATKWGITTHYVRTAVKGTRDSETCEQIKKEYKSLVKKVTNVLNQ